MWRRPETSDVPIAAGSVLGDVSGPNPDRASRLLAPSKRAEAPSIWISFLEDEDGSPNHSTILELQSYVSPGGNGSDGDQFVTPLD